MPISKILLLQQMLLVCLNPLHCRRHPNLLYHLHLLG
jgi:hypothetical protein